MYFIHFFPLPSHFGYRISECIDLGFHSPLLSALSFHVSRFTIMYSPVSIMFLPESIVLLLSFLHCTGDVPFKFLLVGIIDTLIFKNTPWIRGRGQPAKKLKKNGNPFIIIRRWIETPQGSFCLFKTMELHDRHLLFPSFPYELFKK